MTLFRVNSIFVIFSLMCSVHFFGIYYRLGNKLGFVIDLLFVTVAIIFSYINCKYKAHSSYAYSKKTLYQYVVLLKYFFILLFISTVSCLYFHEQNILLTLQSMRTFLFFFIFFMLLKSEIPRLKLESYCYFFALIYCIVFLIQLYLHPIAIVPLGNAEEFDRGLLRLRLEGVGFVTLTGMISLNRFLYTKKTLYLLFVFISFFFIYLLGFRTLLMTYLFGLISIIYFFFGSINLAFLSKFIIFIILYALYQSGFISSFIDDSLEQTMTQLEGFDDYIRVEAYRFLFEDVNVNFYTLIWGNGFPFLESKYGHEVLYIGSELNGFIAADLGLLGFLFYFGALSTFIYIVMLLLPLSKRFDKNCIYLKSYGLYLVISSITTAESFRLGMFGVICVYFYLVVIEARFIKNE